METRIVVMDEAGRLTLPEEARRALGLSGDAEFAVAVYEESGAIVLRLADAARATDEEDTWAFTPEQLESIARGLRDSREGRVRRMTEEELMTLGGLTPVE